MQIVAKLYAHLNSHRLVTEAACTLQLVASRLSWRDEALSVEATTFAAKLRLEGSSSGGDDGGGDGGAESKTPKSERELKEALLRRVARLHDVAKCYEFAIGALKELAAYYEHTLLDYERAIETIDALRRAFANVARVERPQPRYYLCAFYGSRMPPLLKNCKYIVRSGDCEMLAAFQARISRDVGVQLVRNLNANVDELKRLRGRHVQVASGARLHSHSMRAGL